MVRLRFKPLIVAAALAALAGTSMFAWAQNDAKRAPSPSDMNITELAERSDALVKDMESMLKKSMALLEQAIAENKPDAITVRNEAITAMKGLVKLSEQNYLVLRQRVLDKNRDAVEHEFIKISIAHSKVSELFGQVRSAGGVVDVELTDVERTLTIEGSLPQDDALAKVFTEPVDNAPPPVPTSPYF